MAQVFFAVGWYVRHDIVHDNSNKTATIGDVWPDGASDFVKPFPDRETAAKLMSAMAGSRRSPPLVNLRIEFAELELNNVVEIPHV
jgi:hypothetical protein